jgi:hypothetical protein
VYYGGIANMRVVAINPTGDILKQMYNLDDLKEEPKYTEIPIKDNEGLETIYSKVVFHLQGEQFVITDKKDPAGNPVRTKETIKTRLEFLINNEDKIASTGAPLTINALGNSSYQSVEKMMANPKMNWFTKEGPMHQAKVGEVELLEFVRNWMNLGSKDKCNFDNFEAFVKGDVTELKGLAKQRPTNEVTVLLGGNVVTKNGEDKMYQTVYKKAFSRPTAKNHKKIFNDALNESYGDFKAIYPADLELAYVTLPAQDSTPDAAAVATTPVNNNWV